MSQKDGDQALLDRLARDGGRITSDRLTYSGVKAAQRLIKQDRAYTASTPATGGNWFWSHRGQPGGEAMTGTGPGTVEETWTHGGVRAGDRRTREHAWIDPAGEETVVSQSRGARRRRQPLHGQRPPLRDNHLDHRHPRIRRPVPRRRAAAKAVGGKLHTTWN